MTFLMMPEHGRKFSSQLLEKEKQKCTASHLYSRGRVISDNFSWPDSVRKD
jgi:hypothetical protein